MAADDAAQNAANADARLGDRTLDQLQEDVVGLARGYAGRPLPEVFRTARRTRELAVSLVERTRRPTQLADLYTIAGQACGLLSYATFDMGYWDAAGQFADSNLTYADIAGNNSLRAWAMGMRGAVADWQGRPRDALAHFDAALAIAPMGAGTARLRGLEARARAALGDLDGTAQAVRAAEEAMGSDNRDALHDDVGGEFDYNPARQALSAGTAYVSLGDGAAAEQHATRALEAFAALPADRRVFHIEHAIRVDLVTARILRGDLAGARDALAAVFDLPPEQRVAGVTSRLDKAQGLLGADILRNSRTAGDLADDIADFTADTSARAVPESEL